MGQGILLEVRDPDLARRDQLDLRDVGGASLIRRRRALGAWSLQVRAGTEAGDLLRQPGWGLVATLDSGEVFLSGPTQRAEFSATSGDATGTWTLSGYDDSCVLGDLLAWPTPTSSDVTAQTGTAGSGYDQRTGPAESVLRGYVLANAGQAAPADRRAPLLDVAPDLTRGPAITGSARFDQLGELLDALAKAGGDLNYQVRQSGSRLLFEITVPRDLSKLVRFDVANGTAESVTYSYEAPSVTRAVVGGAGDGAARTLLQRWSADSVAAEDLWGRRVEKFLDQQGTTSLAELQQAGDQELATGGVTKTAVTVQPTDTPDVQFGRDYRDGDTVTVVVGGLEVTDVVTEVILALGSDGLTVKATVGDASTALTDPLLRALAATRDQARRLGRLERR